MSENSVPENSVPENPKPGNLKPKHALLPPDAAARDAAKRDDLDAIDNAILGDEFHFATRNVSDSEKAAVIAVITQVRGEETRRMKLVERREHQPWARSQRVLEGIGDLLAEG